MDAYVVVGTNSKGPYSWVLEKQKIKVKNGFRTVNRYWDSLSGKVIYQNMMDE